MSDEKIQGKNFWIGSFNDQFTKLNFDEIQKLKETAKDFFIDPSVFFRHAGIFGSTGSGKTVLGKIICEEAVRHRIPVIAIDPQGDIASLILLGNKDELESQRGIPGEVYDSYKDALDVRIFTPASSKGLPISLNPVKIPEKRDDLEREDIVKMLDAQSKVLIEILKKSAKLSSSIANQAQAGIYTILERYFNSGKQISNLDDLATIIETQEGTGIEEFLDTKQRHKLAISLKTLGVGSAKLLFASNDNLNIDRLLERKIKDGRETTPVNIFFLKSLYTQDEKEFFLQVLVTELYSWMIRQGNAKEPRCVFFCDEIAPFMPAGAAKPGPKDALILLFRQARKYGVQCFIATQSPKDVDYHAYEQFNTFFIGRITSQQSMKVIERILDGFPDSSGKIKGSIESIPVLKAGQFLLVSPDNAVPLALVFTRWLISVHKTLSLDDVKKIMAGKLDDLLDKPVAPPTTKATEPEPATEPELEFIPGPDLSGGSSTEGEQTSPEQRPVAVGVNDQLTIDRAKQVLDSMNESQFSDVIEARVDCTAKIPDNFTNRLVMEKIFNRLGNIAKKDHGIDFLCDLAGKRSLPFETSKMMYYDETKTLIMANLAEIKGDRLAFTFQPMLNEILEELSITKDDRAGVNQPRLEAIFYKLIATPNLKKRLKF